MGPWSKFGSCYDLPVKLQVSLCNGRSGNSFSHTRCGFGFARTGGACAKKIASKHVKVLKASCLTKESCLWEWGGHGPVPTQPAPPQPCRPKLPPSIRRFPGPCLGSLSSDLWLEQARPANAGVEQKIIQTGFGSEKNIPVCHKILMRKNCEIDARKCEMMRPV